MLKLAVAIVAVLTLVGGGYFVVREEGIRSLSTALTERLEAGDYLAALAVAGKLKEKDAGNPELEETISATARLLVAEDTFKKAKQAGEEGRFADARALLFGSDAVENQTFTHYQEARELLAEAEAFAAGKAHQTAVTISTLEEKARVEQGKRQELEQNRKKLENTLSEKEKTLSQSKAETAEARQKVLESERDAAVRQQALIAEQARAKQLMEQVEKESKQKFVTELRVYRDMTEKGKAQLDNAVAEIDAKRDVTALIYLSQGKILFEEVRSKVTEFRNSRTPSAYQAKVDEFAKALDLFLEAGKQFRNTVVYIENQESAEFTGSMSKAKTALASGNGLLGTLSEFISSFSL